MLNSHTSLVTLTVSLRATLKCLSTLFTNQCSALRATCAVHDADLGTRRCLVDVIAGSSLLLTTTYTRLQHAAALSHGSRVGQISTSTLE